MLLIIHHNNGEHDKVIKKKKKKKAPGRKVRMVSIINIGHSVDGLSCRYLPDVYSHGASSDKPLCHRDLSDYDDVIAMLLPLLRSDTW